MKVNMSVLSWIQAVKPKVWWHLEPLALCAGGQRSVSAICSSVASVVSC